jgi:hypothetical protein
MTNPHGGRDIWLVFVIAVGASIVAFALHLVHNEILMYGDAVAHINIARRVFDSRSPGLDQLGTVWLPLPHLLVLPLIVNDWMWRTGVGGSIPSMIAYVAGVLGVFRLTRDNLRGYPRARLASWIAAVVYGANPNLLYMQATAMTESLSLALFVWALVFFTEFMRGSSHIVRQSRATETGAPEITRSGGSPERSLWWCALMLSGEMLTRYDGWFSAAVIAFVLLAFLALPAYLHDREGKSERPSDVGSGKWEGIVARFAVLIAIVPVFWFTYNYRLYGNPLEFATGPYSARAIAERTSRPGDPPYPGKDHPIVAAVYFVKSAALNLAGHRLEGEYGHWWRKNWQQDGWFFVMLAGTVVMFMLRVRRLLLLWIPLPFYALSIAYGGVPIFIPSWWPYSYYNVRYGLQLLPLAAVCAAMLVVGARWWKTITVILLAFIAVTYSGTWRTDPICLREAMVNSQSREELESNLMSALLQIPPDATIFMSLGDHVGALQRAGIPLKQTINENNYYAWREAQRAPEAVADYALAFDDDAVAKAVRDNPHFVLEQTFLVQGQPLTRLYRKKGDRQ